MLNCFIQEEKRSYLNWESSICYSNSNVDIIIKIIRINRYSMGILISSLLYWQYVCSMQEKMANCINSISIEEL